MPWTCVDLRGVERYNSTKRRLAFLPRPGSLDERQTPAAGEPSNRDPLLVPSKNVRMPAHGRYRIPHVIGACRPRMLWRLSMVDVYYNTRYMVRKPRAERRVLTEGLDTEPGAMDVDVHR